MSWARALTALGGAALLASLWLTWFEYGGATIAPVEDGRVDVLVGEDSSSGWHLLSAPEAVALAAIALVAVAASVRPVAARAVRVLGVVAVALVALRIASPPVAGFDAAAGAFVALAAAAATTAGAWLTRRDVA
jgi:hypothetical protein